MVYIDFSNAAINLNEYDIDLSSCYPTPQLNYKIFPHENSEYFIAFHSGGAPDRIFST